MCVSHKSISWNSDPLKRTWLFFKVKTLQRNGTLFSLLTICWHIQVNYFSIQRNTCPFHKSISWNYYHFKRTWLSFHVELLQRKGTPFSLLTKRWHILIKNFSVQRVRNVCFSQKYFMKFWPIKKNVIIF